MSPLVKRQSGNVFEVYNYHIKKMHGSRPSKFPSKKEARGWFSLAGAPLSSVFCLIVYIVDILKVQIQDKYLFVKTHIPKAKIVFTSRILLQNWDSIALTNTKELFLFLRPN